MLPFHGDFGLDGLHKYFDLILIIPCQVKVPSMV